MADSKPVLFPSDTLLWWPAQHRLTRTLISSTSRVLLSIVLWSQLQELVRRGCLKSRNVCTRVLIGFLYTWTGSVSLQLHVSYTLACTIFILIRSESLVWVTPKPPNLGAVFWKLPPLILGASNHSFPSNYVPTLRKDILTFTINIPWFISRNFKC